MRKQTKLVAVASAAALLAIGASMTSFAATGWVEEDGTWYYYDKDGNKVENEWKKSGDNWYWLDSEEGGAMAVDKIIEDDDDYYYVDANGVMVTNTWVKVVNEDQDEDEDPAEYRYYYMQSNGKAYTAGDDGDVKFKTIDGKRYAFDEDGKMLYGWISKENAELVSTDDDSWVECDYYLGDWDDGAMKTGWQYITVYDDDEDEDIDAWFHFKANGKKRRAATTETDLVKQDKINGQRYGFDWRGVMTYEWTVSTTGNADEATISDWRYFRSPEDGARVTKGWFKVVAPHENDDDNTFKEYGASFASKDADDEDERWYYADGDGELYHSQIKKIKGKYYGFASNENDEGGAMLTGLCALVVDEEGNIERTLERNMDADKLDDVMDGLYDDYEFNLYYFGNNEDEDGAMKTGATTVNLDGESYNFYFSKTGGAEGKGRGLHGIYDDKYVYKHGLRLKADSDEKYIVVYASGDTGDDTAEVYEIDSSKLRGLYSENAVGENDDGDTIKFVGTMHKNYKLISTSGSIVENKSAAKDGDDWYFYVDDEQIKMYTNDKDLDDVKDYATAAFILKDMWDEKEVTITNSDTVTQSDILNASSVEEDIRGDLAE